MDAARLLLPALAIAACICIAHMHGFVLCPVKRFLGVPCPSCGATRAVVLMFHGDVAAAFSLQPLVSAIILFLMPSLLAALMIFGRERLETMIAAVLRSRLFWIVAATAILANWAYVIVNGN